MLPKTSLKHAVAWSGPERPRASQSAPERPRMAPNDPKRPRAAPKAAPERPRAPQGGPKRSTEANPKQFFHGVLPWRVKNRISTQGKRHISEWVGRRIFFCLPTLSKTNPKHAQRSAPNAADRPQRPGAAQSGPERPRSQQIVEKAHVQCSSMSSRFRGDVHVRGCARR